MENGTMGEIRLFAGNFAPYQWAFCEGQLLPINANMALFTILGTTYGGDGQTNFALPNLKAMEPAGIAYVICTDGVYPARER
jgi:microcystin-dependent protein